MNNNGKYQTIKKNSFKCLFVYRPFCHGALKSDSSTLFATVFSLNISSLYIFHCIKFTMQRTDLVLTVTTLTKTNAYFKLAKACTNQPQQTAKTVHFQASERL